MPSKKKRLLFCAWLIVSVMFLFSQVEKDDWEEKYYNQLQPPEKVLAAAGISAGLTVGEVGAGRGRYTVFLAKAVGKKGKVYANDIDEKSLAYLRQRCRRAGLTNVEIVLGRRQDPLFPPDSLDLAFMINTYHHLAEPVTLLRNILPALKAQATLVIVERDPAKVKTSRHESTRKQDVLAQAGKAGFKLLRQETFLRQDTIYIFTKNSG